MKIKFNKLDTQSDAIKVSFNGGISFKEYKISDIMSIEGGGCIEFSDSECNDLTKIVIKGRIRTIKDIDSEITELNTTTKPLIEYINDTTPSKTSVYSSNYISQLYHPRKYELIYKSPNESHTIQFTNWNTYLIQIYEHNFGSEIGILEVGYTSGSIKIMHKNNSFPNNESHFNVAVESDGNTTITYTGSYYASIRIIDFGTTIYI